MSDCHTTTRRIRLQAGTTLLLLAASLHAAPVTAAPSFQGTFRGEGMVLTLQPARDGYRGTMIFEERFFAVEAQAAGDRLTGSFSADGGEFDFQASFAGDVLELETNTITYPLRRAAADPAAPEPPGVPQPAEPPGVPQPAEPPVAPQPVAPATPDDVPPQAVEPAAEAADADDSFERDPRLVGSWQRQQIAADGGRFAGEATAVSLNAEGTYLLAGDDRELTGSWRTEGGALILRAASSSAWQTCCRYRLVADNLLLSFDDDSRQLWHRR